MIVGNLYKGILNEEEREDFLGVIHNNKTIVVYLLGNILFLRGIFAENKLLWRL